MPGFHNRYTGMPGLNSYSMPGSATCDTGHKGATGQPFSCACNEGWEGLLCDHLTVMSTQEKEEYALVVASSLALAVAAVGFVVRRRRAQERENPHHGGRDQEEPILPVTAIGTELERLSTLWLMAQSKKTPSLSEPIGGSE